VIIEKDLPASRQLGQPWKAANNSIESIDKCLRLMFTEQLPKLTCTTESQMALVVE
jgi:hypothetical protein